MSTVKLGDGRTLSYDYARATASHDKVVLLSNSLCAPYPTWDHYAKILEDEGFDVLRYDQIGHGTSTVIDENVDQTTFELLANDVSQLLDALNIQILHAWIGISMGAVAGIYFSAANPGRVNRLVICDTITSSPAAAGSPDPFEARIQATKSSGKIDQIVEGTIKRWFSAPWRLAHTTEVDRMRAIMQKTQLKGFIACCRALQDPDFDLQPRLPKLGEAVQSVMLVVGELDGDLPITMAEMRDTIQDSIKGQVGWLVISGAGHLSVVDGLETFSAKVVEFLL